MCTFLAILKIVMNWHIKDISSVKLYMHIVKQN